jgi:GNAT superfamily N-acetyltransferase
MPPRRLPSGTSLERLLESVEAAVYEDFYGAAPAPLARELGVESKWVEGSLRLTARTFDHPMFNRVMNVVDPSEPAGWDGAAGALLTREAAWYREVGVRRWLVQILPHRETDGFRREALARGLVRHRGWAKHVGPAREPEAVPPSDLRVIRLGEEGADIEGPAPVWARIVTEGFGIPPTFAPWLETLAHREGWRLYLALDGDVPAAAAGLHLSSAGGLRFAQLNFAATRPEFRRRGAQSALIARRLADAFELGADWILSETDEELPDRPNPSYHNLVRLGLPVVYVRANWGPPKPGG